MVSAEFTLESLLTNPTPLLIIWSVELGYKREATEVSRPQAKPTDILTADEVAKLCGITRGRVSQLLISGEMKGTKYRGIFWQIERREAKRFATQPEGPGRPRTGA